MRTGSIYIIKNTVNPKVYIGQTTMSVKERFAAHKKPVTRKKRSSYKLYNAMNKYSVENFYVETLKKILNQEWIERSFVKNTTYRNQLC